MAVSKTDAAIRLRWTGRLAARKALEVAAKARHTSAQRVLSAARRNGLHPRQDMVEARDQASADLSLRRKQVAEAQRVIANHGGGQPRVCAPVSPILADSWGWHPGVHDGEDLIANFGDEVVAIVGGTIVDARASGWWNLGAKASSGHPIGDGDGIIQLLVGEDVGPFKKGMVFGYGHTEHAIVKPGQKVVAGQTIGRIGWAIAGHIHAMVNDGTHRRSDGGYSGVGDRDPRPFIDYAVEHTAK